MAASVSMLGSTAAAELARTAGSSLEKAWLDFVDANGHRRPDRGQHTIASANTRADFFYDDYNLAVFIDGPHHDGEDSGKTIHSRPRAETRLPG